jgi:hypothetical protein
MYGGEKEELLGRILGENTIDFGFFKAICKIVK